MTTAVPPGLPLTGARWIGGGGFADVFLGEGPSGPAVAKVALLAPRGGADVTHGVHFAAGLQRHTGGVGSWPVDPAEVLRAEAEQLGALRHPAFPTLLGQGEAGERPYLLLERVTGRPWRDALYLDGELTPGHIGQIARALLEVAQHVPLHGDLKPDNLFVGPAGTVRIIDPAGGLAQTGALGQLERGITSPTYNPGLEASDLPSLGLLLAEVLCRRHLLIEAHEGRPERRLGPRLSEELSGAEAVGASPWFGRLRRLPLPSEFEPSVDPELEALALAALGLRWDGALERRPPVSLEALAAL